MNKREFELLNEVLKTRKPDKETARLKAAAVIKADKINLLKEKEKETKTALSRIKSPENIENHVKKNKEKSDKPKIEVLKTGERIDELIVYCECGEIYRIEFDY